MLDPPGIHFNIHFNHLVGQKVGQEPYRVHWVEHHGATNTTAARASSSKLACGTPGATGMAHQARTQGSKPSGAVRDP